MKIIVAALLFVFCSGTGFAETRDAEQYFFDLKMGDFKSELANAKQAGKTGIMIMFEQAECPFCYRMEHTILNQSEVQDYYPMEDFKGTETTEKAFSLEHRVYGTPVFDFFDLNGNLITRFPGTALDVNEFILLGKCVAEGSCKTMSFSAYKRQLAK
jgi:thioredoxin-related protein